MRIPLDAAEGPTRLVRLPTQFDGTSSAPTLATPTCCCCCCCLTTMVSAPIVWGTLVADDAHRHNRPKGGPVTLAVLSAPLGLVLGGIGIRFLEGGGLLAMIAISVGLLTLALSLAGRDGGSAFGRSMLVHLATAGFFVAEIPLSLLLIAGAVDSSGRAEFGWIYGLVILGGLAGAIVHATRHAGTRRTTPPGLALNPYGMPGTAWPPPSPYGGPVADPGSMMPPVAPQYWQPQAGPGSWTPPVVPPGAPPHAGPGLPPPPAVLPPGGVPPMIPPASAPWAPPPGPDAPTPPPTPPTAPGGGDQGEPVPPSDSSG